MAVVGLALCPLAPGGLQSQQDASLLSAAQEARRAMQQSPGSAAAALELGTALSRLGAIEPALVAFAEARRRDPSAEPAYLLPALLLRDRGSEQQALELVGEGLERLPRSAALRVEHAGLLLRRGLAEQALESADEALALLGESAALLQVRGLALAALPDRRDQAAAVLERSLALLDADAHPPAAVRTTLGELAIEAGDFERAVRVLETAAADHPDVPAIQFRLATALRLAGRTDEAEAATARSDAMRAEADRAEAQAREHGVTLNRAQELANQNRLDEALVEVERAIDQAPSSGRAWALRAKILFSVERASEAIEAIERAREIEPQRIEYHYLAGAFLRSVGRLDDAQAALRDVLSIEPRLGEAHALLGGIAFEQRRLEDAAGHLQAALETGLSTGDLHAAYAQVLDALGRGAESAEQWRLSREARARAGKG